MLSLKLRKSYSPRSSPFLLVLCIIFLLVGLPACISGLSRSDKQAPHQMSSDHSKNKKVIFIAEGETVQAQDCQELYPDKNILGKYIARVQGTKAIVQEHCLSREQTLRDLKSLLTQKNCRGISGCASYDTYRRGPLWPALFMASFNLALREEQIKLGSLKKTVIDDQKVVESQVESSASEIKNGLFTTIENQKVSVQTVKFNLSPQVRCIAKLKNFREDRFTERRDNLDQKKYHLRLSSAPSSGDIWVEYKQTATGSYELIMIEKRLVDDRGEGEVQEQEILCFHPNQPIDLLNSYFTFSYEDLNRDATRVFVNKAQ